MINGLSHRGQQDIGSPDQFIHELLQPFDTLASMLAQRHSRTGIRPCAFGYMDAKRHQSRPKIIAINQIDNHHLYALLLLLFD
ncbi:hypothetical protein [Kushneria pakistanensis]|uniref:hypothetical protein n=1 Tax=Kushneria pakistanensis TaxID=1508770 RepID=UPI00167BC15A|nr:hypothetical protein [Kushneria pakistanensis]